MGLPGITNRQINNPISKQKVNTSPRRLGWRFGRGDVWEGSTFGL